MGHEVQRLGLRPSLLELQALALNLNVTETLKPFRKIAVRGRLGIMEVTNRYSGILFTFNPSTMTLRILSLVFFLITANTTAFAQTSRGPEEIGLRLSSFENFDFIYKKELSQEVYRRVRFLTTNLQFVTANERALVNFNVGAAIGKEKRVRLAEKLKFHHGLEPGVIIGLSNFQDNNFTGRTNVSINPFLGYVLGFQLAVSDRFVLGIETIPSVGVGLNVIQGEGSSFRFNAGFNSNAIALTGVYRFIRG